MAKKHQTLNFKLLKYMAYTETTTTSYGQRLKNSLGGIGSGLLMFIAGTVLLFWNEGNFVKTREAISEAQGLAVHIDDVSQADPALNGKLIHASAFADTHDVLTDSDFGVSDTAIALKRSVEYYQWIEKSDTRTRDKIGGGQEEVTTYTYKQKWTDGPVNSADFHDPDYRDKNFQLTLADDKEWQAKNVTFGAYRLPDFIISSISVETPANVRFTDSELMQWEKTVARNMPQNRRALDVTAGALTDSLLRDTALRYVHASGNIVYLGKRSALDIGKIPTAPAVGDVRITMLKVVPQDISIIAKVNGTTFEKYVAENGREFSAVATGIVSAKNMFASAHRSNSLLTWILRIIGLLLVVGGLKGIFGILTALFRVLPFLADIVGAGVGLVTGVFGFVWSLLVVAVAWLFYRPLIGIILIVVAVGSIIWLKNRGNRKQPALQKNR
jgi:hypothetical protein